MRSIRLTVEYDGTEFHGWQVQPRLRTVQGELEAAAERMTGVRPVIRGASRTDAGVHAAGQVACFLTDSSIPAAQFSPGLTALTGRDVAVVQSVEAPEGWSARFDATGKSYGYSIWNCRQPSPLRRRTSWHVRTPLDIEAMRRAAAALVGRHDFAAFRAAACDAPTTVREMRELAVSTDGQGLVEIRFHATAFLQHMARIITGTLVEVGKGTISPEGVIRARDAGDRALAGPTAPPHGLCLLAVHY